MDLRMDTKELAALMQVSQGHLANLRYRGEGPPYVKESGRVFYPVDSLHQWLQSASQPH